MTACKYCRLSRTVLEISEQLRQAVALINRLAVSSQETFQHSNLHSNSLPLPQVSAQHHQVDGVANAVQVVLLQLEPVVRAFGNFVCGVHLQRLYH